MKFRGGVPNVPQNLYLNDIIKRKSHFLLGPRQTGKSTLLKTVFPDCRYIDV